ncbi:MAG: acylphosphatase [archaeon]|nr:acylphosphatase [archaeon]
MKTIRAKISGTVQGVFFRKFIADEAKKIGLKGHIRNLETGEVEVVAEGSPEKVDSIIACCKKGAPHSVVKKVDVQEMNHIGFDDFKILNI